MWIYIYIHILSLSLVTPIGELQTFDRVTTNEPAYNKSPRRANLFKVVAVEVIPQFAAPPYNTFTGSCNFCHASLVSGAPRQSFFDKNLEEADAKARKSYIKLRQRDRSTSPTLVPLR